MDDAIALLDERGFTRQAFVLRHFTSFRSTDNWWNLYHEHYQAYAATNFPFEIVTLYPWFFELPQDDVERAVVLLHEAHHLMGADEATALRRVWQEKSRLGWTADVYARGKVWKNTREWTQVQRAGRVRLLRGRGRVRPLTPGGGAEPRVNPWRAVPRRRMPIRMAVTRARRSPALRENIDCGRRQSCRFFPVGECSRLRFAGARVWIQTPTLTS